MRGVRAAPDRGRDTASCGRVPPPGRRAAVGNAAAFATGGGARWPRAVAAVVHESKADETFSFESMTGRAARAHPPSTHSEGGA